MTSSNSSPVRAAWLALALAACTSADGATGRTEQRTDVPPVGLSKRMYPLANSSLTPLAPINSVTMDIGPTACVGKPDGSTIDPGDFEYTDARSVSFLELARSRAQVDEALSTKIAASFSSPFASASAEVEASSEASTRAESVYLVGELVAYTNQALAHTCKITLTQDATSVLLDDSGFDEVPAADKPRYRAARFMRSCGDSWTHTRLMGAGGTLIIDWRAQSSTARSSIRAELEIGFGNRLYGGKIGAAVASAKSKLGSSSTLKVTLVTRGAVGGMPDAGDIDSDPNKLTEMVKKLDDLAKVLREGGSVTNLAPMAARLAAYNGMAPWKGWDNYEDEDRVKIRKALDLIKPLAEEMEKFLALRATLIKEIEAIHAQIKLIRDTYPVHFNYDGKTTWNFAGTALLQPFGTTADHSELKLYKTRFDTLVTRLRAEMQACIDSGNDGYSKCKPSTALPTLVARDIVKWRTNRPKKWVTSQVPFTNTIAEAKTMCETYEKPAGKIVTLEQAKFLRAYVHVHLAQTDGHRSFWIDRAVAGEKCSNGAAVTGFFYDATDDKVMQVCGPKKMGTICFPKDATSMWNEAYWKDELDLGALGLLP